MPSGSEVNRFSSSNSHFSEVSPAKSPAARAMMLPDRRLSLVIAARCASVTSAQSVTPTAATIVSRTCSVRSQTSVFPAIVTVLRLGMISSVSPGSARRSPAAAFVHIASPSTAARVRL